MNDETDLPEKILELVKKYNSETVEDFIKQAEQDLGIPEQRILEYIYQLENNGKMKLSIPPIKIKTSLTDYLLSSYAYWFWVTIILSLTTTISVFTISEKTHPLVYIRYILSILFILFLPGFSLIKILFPMRRIDRIELMTLSIGISLALVTLVGLLLNYTPWGLSLIPITTSLLTLTISLIIIGFVREYQERTKNFQDQ